METQEQRKLGYGGDDGGMSGGGGGDDGDDGDDGLFRDAEAALQELQPGSFTRSVSDAPRREGEDR